MRDREHHRPGRLAWKTPTRSLLTASLVAVFTVSCVHKYALEGEGHTAPPIPDLSQVLVPVPEDGRDDRLRSYDGSGEWTLAAIVGQLRARGLKVLVGEPMSPEQAIRTARQAGAAFVVYPVITHWSDRLTEWSGIPDRVSIVISVYRASTSELIHRQEIRASSRWATLGGDHPQDLLPELIRRWVVTVVE